MGDHCSNETAEITRTMENSMGRRYVCARGKAGGEEMICRWADWEWVSMY